MADIIQRLLTQNDCYRAGRTIKPKGIMVHSLGVAQPDPEVFIRSWDRPGVEVAVHDCRGGERHPTAALALERVACGDGHKRPERQQHAYLV